MQQIQLSIPEPCHQSWEAMTPTEQGRFCNACAKPVIDFSTMSDAQVLNYFSHIKNDNVCGRVYPDQLDRTIAMPVQPKKRIFGYWQYITMMFLFFGKGSNAKAQGGMQVVSATQVKDIKTTSIKDVLAGFMGCGIKKPVKLADRTTPDFDNSLQGVAGGIVINNRKVADVKQESQNHIAVIKVTDNAIMQPVDNATLTIAKIGNDKTTLVLTDKKGIVKIEKIKDNETYLIKIIADGYRSQELQISGSDFEERKIHKEIFLEKAPVQSDYKKMDSVVVRSYGNVRMGGVMGGIAVIQKRTYVDAIKTITTKFTGDLKIAPNPVQKGNSFKVELKVKQTGLYQLQLIDAGGQQVMQKQIDVTTKQYTQQVQSELKWSSGTYFMRVLNDKNVLVSTGKLIIL